jgi:hypothetical protein
VALIKLSSAGGRELDEPDRMNICEVQGANVLQWCLPYGFDPFLEKRSALEGQRKLIISRKKAGGNNDS